MELDMLSSALAYIARGWAVFPVHGIVDGHCTCRHKGACIRPGKHPRNSNGRTGATLDPDLACRWWSAWPEANIGIATGYESGIVVLDIDDQFAIDTNEIPSSIEVITGRGGRHVYFQYPTDGAHYLTATNVVAKGVDSRADGGYVVAPPSLHACGKRYAWEASSHPDENPLAPAPEWWLSAIRRVEGPTAEQPAWAPDGKLPENLRDMLDAIPADDYTIWRDVGLALNYSDPTNGLVWWDWWSSTSPKYSAVAVRSQWRSMTRKGHTTARPITLDTIRRLAEQHGYTDPDVEHGAEVAAAWAENERAAQMDAIIQAESPADDEIPTPDLMPRTGLIRDIASWILDTSLYPQPELAVAAATVFVGTLAGRRWRSETDVRTNLYMIGVAASGAGKDHARKRISKLAMATGTDKHIGGSRLASSPGLVSALMREPASMFMLDEFGMMLRNMTKKGADSLHAELLHTLTEIHTTADGIFHGTEYANQTDRPKMQIFEPCCSIYGTTTPEQFHAALTSMQGVDGSLARLIVVYVSNDNPDPCIPSKERNPPQPLVEAVRAMYQYRDPTVANNLVGISNGEIGSDATVVSMTTEVLDFYLKFMVKNKAYPDPAFQAIYKRLAQSSLQLALIYSVSRNHERPIIDPEAYAWGCQFAQWATDRLRVAVSRYVSDTEIQAKRKHMENAIRDAGQDGLPLSLVTRKCSYMAPREITELLSSLVQGGTVTLREYAPAGAGRPSKRYVYVG